MFLRKSFVALFVLLLVPAAIAWLSQSATETPKPPARSAPVSPQPTGEQAKLLKTDSPAHYVHRLTLYDNAGRAIDPSDPEAPPYSPRMTCGKCHAHAEISCGWHFNAQVENRDPTANASAESAKNRNGEPWLYADSRLGVQIPLSLRGSPGTYTPAEIGLSAWQFTLHFGRHLVGGGLSDPAPSGAATLSEPEAPARGTRENSEERRANSENKSEPQAPARGADSSTSTQRQAVASPTETEQKRWAISGTLEIDCMVCHAAPGSGYDAGEIERQLQRQNLRWTPTAALGLGLIRGDARTVSNEFDPENPPPPDRPDLTLPKVLYDKTRFDGDNRVLFEIAREPANERCLHCHSSRMVGREAPPAWQASPDVHMAAGIRCADCHSHGIDHRMVRGFQGEFDAASAASPSHLGVSRTCRGCHLGDDSTSVPNDPARSLGGLFGAPTPHHVGIPPLHFAKLSCTACHSGDWPTMETHAVQTALAHGLGVSTKERRDNALPHITQPVFVQDGVRGLTPTRLVQPAFWAKKVAGKIEPAAIDVVSKTAGRLLPRVKGESFEQPPNALTDDQIKGVLAALGGKLGENAAPAYVRGGRLYELNQAGELQSAANDAGRAYAWPVAHNVRPARQSTGVRGCTDCHAEDGAMFFGRVRLASTALGSAADAGDGAGPGEGALVLQSDYHRYSPRLARTWALLMVWRDAGKIPIIAGVVILAIALIAWLAAALLGWRDFTAESASSPHQTASPSDSKSGWASRTALGLTLLAGAIQGGTSLLPTRFEGWPLVVHSLGIPLFVAGLTLWGVLWTRGHMTRRGGCEWLTWITLCLGLGLMSVMAAALLPIFGQAAMRELLEWHERLGIAFLIGLTLVVAWACASAARSSRNLNAQK